MLKSLAAAAFRAAGYEVIRAGLATAGLSDEDRQIIRIVSDRTMIGEAGLVANLDAVAYVVANEIPGAVVECGVWRGGSVMAMLLKLAALGDTKRDVFLFDTFEGMTAPTAVDVAADGKAAHSMFKAKRRADGTADWNHASLDDVQEGMFSTDYPHHLLHFIKGDVAETIPNTPINQIAILRLDTDWYESTKLELDHYFEMISTGGILIIDDYGHWEGARKAVDEYFEKIGRRPLLSRVDYTRRMILKTW
jgi:O-methyltransferase